MRKTWETDGVIFQNWRVEGGELVREAVQPSRRSILEFNAEVRKNPGTVRKLDWAGLAVNIPELDFYRLQKMFPELNSPDGEIRTKAWRRFFRSSLADPYRVADRSRARG